MPAKKPHHTPAHAARQRSTPTVVHSNSASPCGVRWCAADMYWWPTQFLHTLAQDREVVIFDNPGVGNSTMHPPGGRVTIPYMANTTMALVGALQLEQPDVLGN